MKAQNVKNTVIVPVGAKGGFVPKRLPAGGTREEVQAEVIACYQTFIRGLLDLTDNIVGGRIVPPPQRACAATATTPISSSPPTRARPPSPTSPTPSPPSTASGSATPSPPAARPATTTRRWASRRAARWECVKRHFREIGIDIQKTDFTVAGIGDMSGDVFGNGMLLSRHIRLQAAFDHRHIFLDPDPDAAASFAERAAAVRRCRARAGTTTTARRSRAAAACSRAPPSRSRCRRKRAALLGHRGGSRDAQRHHPRHPAHAGRPAVERRHRHLRQGERRVATPKSATAPTTPCASTAAELGPRWSAKAATSDCTQRGRVEYALAGGRLNTDFIDNSAGVNTSDVEVNIKILLNPLMAGRAS